MTLALEEQRKKAEETLTLLAAAQTNAAKAVEGQDAKAAALAMAACLVLMIGVAAGWQPARWVDDLGAGDRAQQGARP